MCAASEREEASAAPTVLLELLRLPCKGGVTRGCQNSGAERRDDHNDGKGALRRETRKDGKARTGQSEKRVTNVSAALRRGSSALFRGARSTRVMDCVMRLERTRGTEM